MLGKGGVRYLGKKMIHASIESILEAVCLDYDGVKPDHIPGILSFLAMPKV